MDYSYYDDTLTKHNVSRSDVNEVLAETNTTTRVFDLPLSARENLRLMFVGITSPVDCLRWVLNS